MESRLSVDGPFGYLLLSMKSRLSVDGLSEKLPPSMKTAVSVDGPFEYLLLSMKSRLSVDGRHKNAGSSTKSAVFVDGTLVKEAGLSLRKQFLQNCEVKPEQPSQLLVGSIVVKVQMSRD